MSHLHLNNEKQIYCVSISLHAWWNYLRIGRYNPVTLHSNKEMSQFLGYSSLFDIKYLICTFPGPSKNTAVKYHCSPVFQVHQNTKTPAKVQHSACSLITQHPNKLQALLCSNKTLQASRTSALTFPFLWPHIFQLLISASVTMHFLELWFPFCLSKQLIEHSLL